MILIIAKRVLYHAKQLSKSQIYRLNPSVHYTMAEIDKRLRMDRNKMFGANTGRNTHKPANLNQDQFDK